MKNGLGVEINNTGLDLGLEEKVLVIVLTKISRYFQDLEFDEPHYK